jgi:hypothetical protein
VWLIERLMHRMFSQIKGSEVQWTATNIILRTEKKTPTFLLRPWNKMLINTANLAKIANTLK